VAPALAGLRTNTLVSLGAAIFVVFAGQFTDSSPTRVAAQVVTGIGFLGAGVIWKEGVNVRGLSTAASIDIEGPNRVAATATLTSEKRPRSRSNISSGA
jgi:uncharacterized membrane protein YhiD involved in acid resistance